MAIEQEEIDFIATKFREVEGWCLDDAAYLTLWLMNTQTQLAYDSSILEIGVYKGKYLSVLYQRATRTLQPVVGIDTFQWSPSEVVSSKFLSLFGSLDGLSLVNEDSNRLDAPQAMKLLGGKRPSFISVDGDHAARSVRNDLGLAKAILGNGGIIAVDDFLNPMAISVSEGFYRFFIETGESSLRPFAYCGNKLFCAERAYLETYGKAVWAFVESMPNLPQVQQFNRHLALGRGHVEQDLLGTKVLIF
jgi:hypothetical protein